MKPKLNLNKVNFGGRIIEVNSKPKPRIGTLAVKINGSHVTIRDDGYSKPTIQTERPKLNLRFRPAAAPDGMTDWYNGDQKPMHVGVFEREGNEANGLNPEFPYSWWNGIFWCVGGRTPAAAMDIPKQYGISQPEKWYIVKSRCQNARWRGFTHEQPNTERAHNAPD